MPDVLITGLPRSGLTLAAALIDSLPGAVCLNSPQVQAAQARKLQETIPFCKWLAGDFVWQRSRLGSGHEVNDYRGSDGDPLLDGLKDPRIVRDEDGAPRLTSLIRRDLSGDFILAMKHDALYTCVLPTLVQMEHFRIIALIRHPYDTIASWQSLPGEQIAQGQIPFARSYWPQASILDPERPADLIDRMVQIYELFLGRYHEYKDHIHLIRYEDMVANPALLSDLLGKDMPPPAASKIMAAKRPRRARDVEALRERFRKYGVYARQYYPDL